MAISTVATVTSTLINDIIADALFVLREVTLMPNLVTNYTGDGMAVRRVPIFGQASATEVAEGVDFSSPTTLSKTQAASFTPKTEMVQYILTDERVATDPDNARAAAAMEMGGALGESVDTDLTALFSGFSTDKGDGAGTTASIANAAAGIAVLRHNKVRGNISAVMHNYHWHDLWTELGQPIVDFQFLGERANEALRDYYVSSWLGIAWFTTSNITIDASDDAVSGIFGRQALALDTRRAPTVEVERDASLRADEINMHMWYAVGELRDNHGIAFTADATEPA